MNEFLSWSYWFILRPAPWQELSNIVLGLSIGLVVLFILFKIIIKVFRLKGVNARVLTKLAVMFLTLGLLSLVFWFFRLERVPFFSARFWWLALILLFLIWLVFIFIFWLKKKPEEREAQLKAVEFDKYLPPKK